MNKLKTPILNRYFEHPDDGWYHIEAFGEHPHHEANVVQIIDTEAASSIEQVSVLTYDTD